ncbi:unnamed protein product [Thelazia callipaeda]|uniref:Uncharacterized protein n=1 Tax=Thelazia callipaeda TaxID=103827 RepID=A0A0N5CK18_THECL|nr:unnamed protein product [Thelazia callipaeda]
MVGYIEKQQRNNNGDENITRNSPRFLDVEGLEVNSAKSATNTEVCADKAALLEGTQGYKYLGIVEERTSAPARERCEEVRAEILIRIERLARTALNC